MLYVSVKRDRLIEPYPLMKYIQIYLLCTIALYFIGPIEWKTRIPFFTFFIVLLYQLMLYLGYAYGRAQVLKKSVGRIFTAEWYVQHYSIIACIVLVTKFMRIVRVMFLYGFSDVFSLIKIALTSGSSIYTANKLAESGSQMFGGSVLSFVIALLGPITVSFIPLTVMFFRSLSRKKRIIGIAAIVVFIISSLVFGTNEGYFDSVLFLVSGLLLRKGSGVKISKRQKRWRKLLLIVGAVAVIFFFNIIMTDRNSTYYRFSQLGENTVKLDSWLISIIPDNFKVLLIWLAFYVCQGYYGMSLALISSWTPMFGMGFSSYLRSNIEGMFGVDLASNTLMAQTAQFGWKYGLNWHTAYTWFACDIWWFGVLILMFFIGKLFAKAYFDAYYNQNPVAVGLFTLLLMMMVFLPANNKVFADSSTFFAFFFYIFALFFSKKEYVNALVEG